MKSDEIYERVATRIIAAIESDPGHWHKSWRGPDGLLPTNATTGKRYQGGNVIWLQMAGFDAGYTSSKWATFKQWQSLGAQVLKGSKATFAIKWGKTSEKERDGTGPNGETVKITEPGHMFAQTFALFNACQTTWADPTEAIETTPLQRIEHAEQFFAAVPCDVRWGAGNPAYWRTTDHVTMPAFDAFDSPEDAYGTLAHELAHWTGAESRLDRKKGRVFGDTAYAWEELTAELSACFTMAVLGIESEPRADHAQYLASWIKGLSETPKAIWTVASAASKATEMLAAYSDGAANNETEMEMAA